jgi:hypothetical protein
MFDSKRPKNKNKNKPENKTENKTNQNRKICTKMDLEFIRKIPLET